MAKEGFIKRLFGPGRSLPDLVSVPSPVSGRIVPLSSLSDMAFAEKMMGEGVAVVPDEGSVRSPFAGTVETVAQTGHAVGLRSDAGLELLVHVGIETVKLGGKHFRMLVAEGDRVAAGQVLIEFDLEALRAEGYDTAVPVTVINGDEFAVESAAEAGTVDCGEPLLAAKRRIR